MHPSRHTKAFRLVHRAILERKQATFTFDGRLRETCPIVLGWNRDDEEVLLAYQFAGASSRPLPAWRCFRLAGISLLALRDGAWLAPSEHRKTQTCVARLFIDVNTDVPNQPGRR